MSKRPPRERAARALCRRQGLPEDTKFQGMPMWRSLLDDADAVLEAALEADQWELMRALGPPDEENR